MYTCRRNGHLWLWRPPRTSLTVKNHVLFSLSLSIGLWRSKGEKEVVLIQDIKFSNRGVLGVSLLWRDTTTKATLFFFCFLLFLSLLKVRMRVSQTLACSSPLFLLLGCLQPWYEGLRKVLLHHIIPNLFISLEGLVFSEGNQWSSWSWGEEKCRQRPGKEAKLCSGCVWGKKKMGKKKGENYQLKNPWDGKEHQWRWGKKDIRREERGMDLMKMLYVCKILKNMWAPQAPNQCDMLHIKERVLKLVHFNINWFLVCSFWELTEVSLLVWKCKALRSTTQYPIINPQESEAYICSETLPYGWKLLPNVESVFLGKGSVHQIPTICDNVGEDSR